MSVAAIRLPRACALPPRLLASVVGQGTPVPWIAARLRIPMR
jgi:hypothetical protein